MADQSNLPAPAEQIAKLSAELAAYKQASLMRPGGILDEDGIPLQVKAVDNHGGAKVVTVCRADVTLTVDGGGITMIQGKAEIDSEGYRKLNRVAGLHILNPPTVIVDGREVGNPHYERNEVTKSIQRVVIRKAVVGLSPLGKQVVVDKTLHFDTAMYMNQMLVKLVDQHPACGCMGTKQHPPKEFTIYKYDKELKEKVKQGEIPAPDVSRLYFFPLHGDEFGLWIDTRHPEVSNLWKEFSQMLQFVSRRAETTVVRLCLQDHPAIGAKRVKTQGGKAKVPVFFHQDGLDVKEIRALEESMRGGRALAGPAGIEVMSATVDGLSAAEEVAGEGDDAVSEVLESGDMDDAERGFGD